MELTEQQLIALEKTIEGLRSDIRELQYKVTQLEYYKADESIHIWNMKGDNTMATPEEMDTYSIQAEAELTKHISEWDAIQLIDWWYRWVGRAGHKRLYQSAVSLAKEWEACNGDA